MNEFVARKGIILKGVTQSVSDTDILVINSDGLVKKRSNIDLGGTSGSSGTSGNSGSSGTSGSGGTSGVNGTSGTNGSSGTSGVNGTSGTNGSSGTSGVNGTSGTNGSNGTSGSGGTSGVKGGVPYNFSTTTTDADPGNGIFRYNNSTISSVTFIYIDNLDQLSNTQTSWYNTWDDSTNTHKGTLTLFSRDNGTYVNIFNITGNVTVASGYYKIPVTYVSGSLPINSSLMAVGFNRTGNVGDNGTSGSGGTSGTNGSSGVNGTSGTSGNNGDNGTYGTPPIVTDGLILALDAANPKCFSPGDTECYNLISGEK